MLIYPRGLNDIERVQAFTGDKLEYVTLDRPANAERRRRPPLTICDPHETNMWKNGAYNRPALIEADEVFCVFAPDARVTGHRLVVEPSGGIISDTPMRLASQRAQYIRSMLMAGNEDCEFVQCGGDVTFDRLNEVNFVEHRPCVSLLSVEPSNYGSWLFRIAAKIALMHLFGIEDLCVICWAPFDWQLQILEFFGVPKERVISIDMTKTYRFPNGVFVPANINSQAYVDEITLSFFYKCMRSRGILYHPTRNLVVSRVLSEKIGKSYYRKFVHEESFLQTMQDMQFEVVAPDTLDFAQQVSLFASAKLVVGASGSGLFNTIFSPPGSFVIDIEAFPHWLHAHTNLFSSVGLNYGLAFGIADQTDLSEIHKRWSIDVSELASYVKRMSGLQNVDW